MTLADLVATTVRLPAGSAPDLLALSGSDGFLFARDGIGLAGAGVAGRVPRDGAVAELASIEHEAEPDPERPPGAGPVAFAALPFLPGAPVDLVIPELVLLATPDGAWATTIRPSHTGPTEPVAALAARLDQPGRPSPADGPASFEVRAVRPPSEWQAAVAEATQRIRSGEIDKVVLAREIEVVADRDLSVATVLLRLGQQFPGCYLYLVDGFCGASPELLVARDGDQVRAQPMAGTKPRRGDPEADAVLARDLLASPSYRHEHQVTIDAVHDTLLTFASYVDYEPEPSVVPLANVVHLATQVEGRLSHPPASILELVDALHPTPAVCGRPRDAALRAIAELEHLDRGRYAGAVGWVDASGNGAFAVAIRGAEISGPRARVIAGNGVVADSDPPTELIETRAKLQAMLSAIVRP
jgi:isochorismate synthase